MRTSVYGCRWPRFFVQPSFFLRKWTTFLCLPWPTISPSTAAPKPAKADADAAPAKKAAAKKPAAKKDGDA